MRGSDEMRNSDGKGSRGERETLRTGFQGGAFCPGGIDLGIGRLGCPPLEEGRSYRDRRIVQIKNAVERDRRPTGKGGLKDEDEGAKEKEGWNKRKIDHPRKRRRGG